MVCMRSATATVTFHIIPSCAPKNSHLTTYNEHVTTIPGRHILEWEFNICYHLVHSIYFKVHLSPVQF